MPKRSSVAVLVSGGLDSAALVWDAAKRYRRVYPVFIRQGLRWENAEHLWLKRFLSSCRRRGDGLMPLTILKFPVDDLYKTHWSLGGKAVPSAHSSDSAVYLPGRNLLLTLKAAVFCAMNRIPSLWIGSLDHNPFPDATPAFFRIWGKALGQGLRWPIRIEAPFRHRTKVQIILASLEAPLRLSFSCLAPRGSRHCGRCNKCAERQKAFRDARIRDKTIYAKK